MFFGARFGGIIGNYVLKHSMRTNAGHRPARGAHGKVFTVANGITSEVFYPRLDVDNMQDMQQDWR